MSVYLAHHGVLGMKWGIRRYQPYRDGEKKGKEVGEAAKKSSESDQTNYAPSDKTKKILVGLGVGLAVSALAVGGYAMYKKYGKDYLDMTIKKGTMLQTLSSDRDRTEKGNKFYAAFKSDDIQRYRKMFGQSFGNPKVNIQNKTLKKMKVASPKSAEKVFKDLYESDEKFRSNVYDSIYMFRNDRRYDVGVGYAKKLKKGGFDSLNPDAITKIYEAYNASLINWKSHYSDYQDKFFEALKKKGYSGLIDINDYKYSGFNSSAPVIIFDKSKYLKATADNLTMSEIKESGKKLKEIEDAKKKTQAILDSGVYGLPFAAAAAGGAGGYGVAEYQEKNQDKRKA